MSKTYRDQMAKAKMLIAGLKNNAEWATQHNISMDELSNLEQQIAEGERLNACVDELRDKIKTITQDANGKLISVKQRTQAMKREVKMNVDITRWTDFGIPDKR